MNIPDFFIHIKKDILDSLHAIEFQLDELEASLKPRGLTNFEKNQIESMLLPLIGKPYEWGIEVPEDTPLDKIRAFDCSEMVEWLYKGALGYQMPDGSWNQFNICERIQDPECGDLGFKKNLESGIINHVGVVINHRFLVEAKGHKFGIVKTPIMEFESSINFAAWGRPRLVKIGGA